MNKSRIRISHSNTYHNTTSSLFFWTVFKKIENQNTVDNLIKTFKLKTLYK